MLNISLAIAAYNSERTITDILKALQSQIEDGFRVENIYIHIDLSTDSTLEQVRGFSDPRIKIIHSTSRVGFLGSVKRILENTKVSDVTILFNDDIKLTDTDLLNKLVKPFLEDPRVGLVCGNPTPLSPINFVDSVGVVKYRMWDTIRMGISNGQSIHSQDGKILAISKEFNKKLTFPKNNELTGNVDIYIYFSCIALGFKYRFVRDAVVLFRNPTTWREYLKWNDRNFSQREIMQATFPDLVANEYTRPKGLFIKAFFREISASPRESVIIFFHSYYLRLKRKIVKENSKSNWEVLSSTKKLD